MRCSVVAFLFVSIIATSAPAYAQEDSYLSDSASTQQSDGELSEIVQTLLAPELGLQE